MILGTWQEYFYTALYSFHKSLYYSANHSFPHAARWRLHKHAESARRPAEVQVRAGGEAGRGGEGGGGGEAGHQAQAAAHSGGGREVRQASVRKGSGGRTETLYSV